MNMVSEGVNLDENCGTNPSRHLPGLKTAIENQKNKKMALLTVSELFSKKTSLRPILRPNLWAKNDPMVILSLSTFREKVRCGCIFQ